MLNVERIVNDLDADTYTRNKIEANMKGIAPTINDLNLNEKNIHDIQMEILMTMKYTENFEPGKLYTGIPGEDQICKIIANTIENQSLCNSNSNDFI